MAFVLDLFGLVAAAALFGAAAWSWRLIAGLRQSVRLNLRFAIALFAALAAVGMGGALAADLQPVLLVVALLIANLGSAVLALAVFAVFSRPPSPSLSAAFLAAALAAGLAAGVTGMPVLAMACQGLIASPVIVIGFGRLGDVLRPGALVLGGGFALLCAGMALMDRAVVIALLFLAAALLSLARASQLGVEQDRARRGLRLIG